jgi:hypothetical protein
MAAWESAPLVGDDNQGAPTKKPAWHSAPVVAPAREEKQGSYYDRIIAGAKDVAQSAGTGLERGAASIPGIPGDVINLAEGAHRYVGDLGRRLGVNKSPPSAPETNPLPTTQNIMDYAQKQGLPVHTPTTTAGRYAESIGGFDP